MKKRKLVSLLLVLTTAFVFLLSGCKSNAPADTTGGNNSTSTTTTTDTQKAADNKAETPWTLLEPLNKDPGELTLPRSNYVKYPVEGAEGITLRYWMPLPSNVSKKSATVNETEWARIWQEMTGIKVEFIHPTQGSENEEFSVLIAGNLLPDIIEWEWTTSYPGGPAAAEEEGVLINLDEYISPYGAAADLWQYLQDNPIVDREVKNDEGHYYCFPFIRGHKYLQCTSGLFYRADLFKKAGITKTPVTIDDWTEALTKLKEIGVQKPMVMQSMDNLQNGTMNAYLIRPGMYVDHETGKVKYGFIEEGYKQWMLQMNEWVKAGLLDPDVLTCDRTTLETYIMTGVGAVTYGAGGGYMGSFLTIAKAEPDKYGADFDLRAANFPVLKEGDPVLYGGASYDYATTSKASAVITSDCKYPEIAAKFLNFAYSEKGHYAINFGEEGKSYNMVNGEPVYTDLIMKNPEGLTVAVAMAHWGRANMSGAFVQDPRYIFQYYETEQQKEALHIWNDTNDSQKTLIPPVTLTQEESKRFAALNSQVDTYVKEQRARFFTMEGNIEAEWDNYVKTLKDMGVDEMIAIYQAALDRYNAR
ncbi:extracellular solute-binding protein family 1 [Thermoclostridium stercorarium subsp. stercorarium DSM 8532]|uniref:Extracellular solute-binding protein family 1 n=2 Tax=Thermoclostridium stercorarium TaxID=1510 RepID=L7VTJ0_THES1|nr:extracellular solute-binding protein [Thermoclostridium stercorarium]AGC69656.1 extracellular solute-binding protein family 1 [Thermoclostridium stercorarium subsp. stercorarium DSM 8532]AGI40608.1 ABC transporter periplasmic subunit [Thermoclostridium stercorarium subsp. stercorarium DSM 8532]ANX02504.1 ABC transporter substrate-binding protein [Thermoclostridium stercorarium subsp. leptospartum DSM 9219]